MKELLIILALTALLSLTGSFLARAQGPSKPDAPTFYNLIPGTYVNGYPRFTMHHPADWVERLPRLYEVFYVSAPSKIPVPSPRINSWFRNSTPLGKWPDSYVTALGAAGLRNVTSVGDKASQLRDGTPVREVTLHGVINDGPFDQVALAIRRGDALIAVGGWLYGEMPHNVKAQLHDPNFRLGDLRKILYSIEFEQGKDQKVSVPSDVQEFLDSHNSAVVSHDLAKLMTHYSDRFLHSSVKKRDLELFFQWIHRCTSNSVEVRV